MDRQKLLTIFGVAWVSAALLTWFLYAKTKGPKTEATVKIMAAARDLPAGTMIGKKDLKLITIAERDKPGGALVGPQEALNRALLFPVNQNEPITAPKLSTLGGAEGVSATIQPGMRAVSVAFTDATGASGLLQPRSHVDVLFTRTGSLTEAMTVTLLEDVVVLSVGRNTEVQQTGVANVKTAVRSSTSTQTATLMVTPEQAQKLELGKNQGKISLALRNPSDRSIRNEPKAAVIEEIDPLLLMRSGRRGGVRMPGVNVRDQGEWANLIGGEGAPKKKAEEKKEPPKPKLVVDVFRGDKHVQEIFP
ncbi:MAG TPA: Flp pilus assembly protein CpaB [Bryobacteraceae bacterium]|nr:Flp pilus assembly protein CpaB [Bryobacteraceae bacterium]